MSATVPQWPNYLLRTHYPFPGVSLPLAGQANAVSIKAEAKFYGDGKWYPGIVGESTQKGKKILFIGYEDDGWQVNSARVWFCNALRCHALNFGFVTSDHSCIRTHCTRTFGKSMLHPPKERTKVQLQMIPSQYHRWL
jgi:hypothetical protein